jgi:stage II sporulation protein P
MKRTSATLHHSGKVRNYTQQIGMTSRMFGTLALGTVLFFVVLVFAGYLQSSGGRAVSPVSSMKGFAASVSGNFFTDMIAMEIPHMKKAGEPSSFSQNNVLGFIFRYLTDVDAQDPKSLVSREVPGMANERTTLLRKGVASAPGDQPMDTPPAAPIAGGNEGGAQGKAPGGTPPDSTSSSQETGQAGDPAAGSASSPENAKPPVVGNNVTFIYHSHNLESFLPELPGVKDPDKAYDAEKNITLVGKRLAAALERAGVGAVHSDTNYPAVVPNFNYAYSYKYSLQTLKEATAAHKDLLYFFDIHRDSGIRSKTTVNIGGVDYAQVYFILGEKNPHWKENEQFAARIHAALEAKHPGISKGIHAKSSSGGNGEYNQSFSPNSVLIEIGGPYNTLEECYRTADLLAEAIAEVVLEAQAVGAQYAQ